MKTIKANAATKENFAKFGTFYSIKNEGSFREDDGFKAWMAPEMKVGIKATFGFTVCDPGEFECDSMERHLANEEALVCGDAPMVVTVADSDPMGQPKEEDIMAFIVNPGDYVVLNRGIWHDANHGVDKKTYYYWISQVQADIDDPTSIDFIDVVPAPVKVTF